MDQLYAVVGDTGTHSTALSDWPSAGTPGPVPKHGVVGSLADVLPSLGADIWVAQWEPQGVRLLSRVEGFGSAAALSWAADCVEHAVAQFGDTANGDVAACIVLARNYAQKRAYDAASAHALAGTVRAARAKLDGGVLGVVGKVLAEVADMTARGDLREELGWRRAEQIESAYEGSQSDYARQEKALRQARCAVLDAGNALCGADPLSAAREAAAHCRKAGDTEAVLGDLTEAQWQAARLAEYLKPPQAPAQPAA